MNEHFRASEVALTLVGEEPDPVSHPPDAWPDPQPLPDVLPPVLAFDPAILPMSLRGWIEDIAERVQCPLDYPAVGATVALAAVVGRRVGNLVVASNTNNIRTHGGACNKKIPADAIFRGWFPGRRLLGRACRPTPRLSAAAPARRSRQFRSGADRAIRRRTGRDYEMTAKRGRSCWRP